MQSIKRVRNKKSGADRGRLAPYLKRQVNYIKEREIMKISKELDAMLTAILFGVVPVLLAIYVILNGYPF